MRGRGVQDNMLLLPLLLLLLLRLLLLLLLLMLQGNCSHERVLLCWVPAVWWLS
jgi:hypothetical protein